MAGGLSAVATLHELLQSGREPSELEREDLSRFPGWGASPGLFDPKDERFEVEREFLSSVWTEKEWQAARRTVINAHYTNPAYVSAMWDALGRLGVPVDVDVLEPGCGTGNFIARAPEGTRMLGVELDPTTAKIAGMLHGKATILNESFADTVLPGDGVDAVIGNVPFSEVRLHDPAYNRLGLSMHNHFIVKSLRLTKPGGIVAVMSSRFTLDAKSGRSREEIAKYGEFLGAVRMPRGAHQETAGTDATIDVLVFRRHEADEALQGIPAWLNTSPVVGAAGEAEMNDYFHRNPEMVLGDVSVKIGRFGAELSVTAEDATAANVSAGLHRALTKITTNAIDNGKGWAVEGRIVADRPVARVAQDQTRLVGRVFVNDTGDLCMNGVAGVEPVNIPKNAVNELHGLLELRDAAVELLEAESATGEDTQEISDLRAGLNEVYDRYVTKYGALGRFTERVRERVGKEPIVTRRYPAALRALRTDPHFATVVALERFNEGTGEARKATIFTQRVVGAKADIVSVANIDDAVRVSMDQFGKVDPAFMSDLLDQREAEVIEQLGNRAFQSLDGDYVLAAEFLSGNVRKRLKEYQDAAAEDQKYEKHVAALTEVVPEELGPSEISVKFGAAWLPEPTMEQFIGTVLGTQVSKFERLNGEWRFDLSNRPNSVAEQRWGVDGEMAGWNARRVVDAVMNQRPLRVTYKVDEREVVDEDATEVLQERAAELHDAFQDWLWQDGERAEEHQALYNDLYNGTVLRSYDDVRLTFPGKAASFTPHPHQHAAVARMLAEPSVGLFHEVGAGKTAEIVLGVAELKRLGMVQKPAIIVPNQMLEQFTREYKQIYPQAQILAGGSEDVSMSGGAAARKLFVHRAKTNNWDAVILTHSAFTSIGLGEAKQAWTDMKLQELETSQLAIMNSDIANVSVKTLETARVRAEEALKKALDVDQDEGVSWEETGIDYLAVDELHLFKNLMVLSKIPDLAKRTGSDRAQDLEQKLWYHREPLGQKRVLTGATATPLPNSMIEMFVMMRYLRPDLLQEAKVYEADDWAAQFTEQKAAVEAKPGGGGFRVKTRTTQFRNLPELLQMWHVPGDVKTQADLKLNVPQLHENASGNRAPEMVIVPPTAEQVAIMADIVDRAEKVSQRAVSPEEDNMLKITGDGRAAALDARLLDGEAPEPGEQTKADVAVERIFNIWEEHKDREFRDEWGEIADTPGAFQIVFADLATPKDHGWNVYDHIRDGLVAKGMPRELVRFMHEAGNDKAKAELFQQCRDGRVSVLIGSTGKMGVGTNVQARAVALHHIDAPWRPADVTQREGRIVRQGNQNSEIQIIRYSTEGSFDAYMWGTLARKAAFIEQVLSGRLDVREADNSSEMALQFAEMQAVTLGDMRVLDVANLREDIQKLTRQERGHQRQADAARGRRLMFKSNVHRIENDIQVMLKIENTVQPTSGDLFRATVKTNAVLEPRSVDSRADFGKLLKHQIETSFTSQKSRFGSWNKLHTLAAGVKVGVGGIVWSAAFEYQPLKPADPLVKFSVEGSHRVLQVELPLSRIVDGDVASLSRSFENQVTAAPCAREKLEVDLVSFRNDMNELEVIQNQPWPMKQTLEEKRTRLLQLLKELEAEAMPAPGPAPPPPAQTTQYVSSVSPNSDTRHVASSTQRTFY